MNKTTKQKKKLWRKSPQICRHHQGNLTYNNCEEILINETMKFRKRCNNAVVAADLDLFTLIKISKFITFNFQKQKNKRNKTENVLYHENIVMLFLIQLQLHNF